MPDATAADQEALWVAKMVEQIKWVIDNSVNPARISHELLAVLLQQLRLRLQQPQLQQQQLQQQLKAGLARVLEVEREQRQQQQQQQQQQQHESFWVRARCVLG
eukprot:TRINITY_DN30152_c0_g1_i1.p1 TRINITY_DN30152_c0_g1~~TRINITY_DN30152_c0_g1_i1.p1  ORF type:complete len:122 (+),score=39.69 TRINITY_DN30152_c0_g1_i1:57-368(+)